MRIYNFSVNEISDYLGINAGSFYHWKEAGKVPESYDSQIQELMAFKEGVRAVSYTHLDVYKRQFWENVKLGLFVGFFVLSP